MKLHMTLWQLRRVNKTMNKLFKKLYNLIKHFKFRIRISNSTIHEDFESRVRDIQAGKIDKV